MVFQKARPAPESPGSQTEGFYQAAVKALARRARSCGEIRLFLQRRKAGKSEIDLILGRLRENGYLDDARFARAFVAARLEDDLHGQRRVRQELRARRVHPEVIEQAIASGYEKVDEGALLRKYLKRKVRLPRALSKPSAVASLYRRLLRAGFSSATIVRELKKILRGMPSQNRVATDPVLWEEWLDSLAESSDGEPEA
ncbi:MAG: RecX family transcriptional regulator [Acidobacteria bacterium]|nr:RecX family transcriptional regulator [Acidobacteriota bacterium]